MFSLFLSVFTISRVRQFVKRFLGFFYCYFIQSFERKFYCICTFCTNCGCAARLRLCVGRYIRVLLVGGSVLLMGFSWQNADYILSIFPQIEKSGQPTGGGVFQERKKIKVIICFYLGKIILKSIFNFGLRK